METKHELVIKVIDFHNNDLQIGSILPMDCNLNTVLTAIRVIDQRIRQEADKYAQNRGYGSMKEMPKNFRETLKLEDIMPKDAKPVANGG